MVSADQTACARGVSVEGTYDAPQHNRGSNHRLIKVCAMQNYTQEHRDLRIYTMYEGVRNEVIKTNQKIHMKSECFKVENQRIYNSNGALTYRPVPPMWL